jgi:hypothetical protein
MIIFEVTEPENIITVDNEIERIKHLIVDKELSPKVIAAKFQRALRKKYGIVVTTHEDSKAVEPDAMNLNGYFDPSKWMDWENIELVLAHHRDDADGIVVDDSGWKNLKFRVKQALMHEFIHREQWNARDGIDGRKADDVLSIFKKFMRTPDEEQVDYLSDDDEIEAHSHDIAIELHNANLTPEQSMQELRGFSNISSDAKESSSLTLWAYGKYFKKDMTHPVIKKMLKKTYQYLQYYAS